MISKIKFIIPLLALAALLIPGEALAFIGTGIFDFFDSALSGIEETSGPVIHQFISFIITYGIGLLFLQTSIILLQFASNPHWLDIQGNGMVEAGWQFTSGMANMLIIVILIIIAFAFILKIENFKIKQSLPKLLLVALFINFSKVFVGAIVDLSTIIYNTFLLGNENLVSDFMHAFGVSGSEGWGSFQVWLLTVGASFIIPFVSPFFQYGIIGILLGTMFTNFLVMFFQIFLFFTMGGIFLIYTILFAARIFIIQLLAIISPLAFLCLILPQTKKYWDKWLHTLLEWAFLGVALFFFLVLGLKAVNGLAPAGGIVPTPFLESFNVGDYFIYYFFLAIYLVVAGILSKKMMPAFAQAIIDQAVGLGKMAWGGALVPMASGTKQRLDRLADSQKRKEDDLTARRAEAADQKIPFSLRRGERIGMALGRWTRKGVEFGHKLAGTSISSSVEKSLDDKVGEYEKRYGKDYKTAAALSPRIKDDFNRAALALYLEKIKGGKALNSLTPSQLAKNLESVAEFKPDKMADILRHMPELSITEEAEKKFGLEEGRRVSKAIHGALVSDGLSRDPVDLKYKDKDVQKLSEEGTKREDLLQGTAMKKVVDNMKISDLDSIDVSLGSNKTFQEILAKWKNDRNFLQRTFEKMGPTFIKGVQDAAEKNLESAARTNPSLVAMQSTQFGLSFMDKWKKPGGGTLDNKNQIKNFINTAGSSPSAWQPIEGLPSISPQPTEQDKNRFAAYAQGKLKYPMNIDTSALKELNGAINAAAYRVREVEGEITNLRDESSRATGDRKKIKEREIIEENNRLAEYQTRETEFKRRAFEVEKGLAKKVKNK